jgi:replicative DNA helicase
MASRVETVSSHLPPQNIEAEQSTLGCMMLEQQALWTAREIVKEPDFYRPTHGIIYRAIVALEDREEPVDLRTVQEELKKMGKLNEVGGTDYLMALLDSIPTAAHIESYASIVKDKADKRRLIATGQQIMALGYDTEISADEAKQNSVSLMLESVGDKSGGSIWMTDAVSAEYDAISERFQAGGIQPTICTGIRYLDLHTLGFQPGLNLICGRPSNGKTALLLQIAFHSMKHGPFLCFSLETTEKSLARRLLAADSGVDMLSLRAGTLDGDDWPKLADAASRIHNLPLLLDTKSKHIDQITAATKRAILQHKITAVFIDYVQIVDAKGRDEREVCSHVSKRLSALGLEYNIPIIGAAILNREADRDVVPDDVPLEETRPMLKHIKGSGQFEQDAQLAVLINNPKRKTEDGKPRDAELIFAKQKDGATGIAACTWEPKRFRFRDTDKYHEEPSLPYWTEED